MLLNYFKNISITFPSNAIYLSVHFVTPIYAYVLVPEDIEPAYTKNLIPFPRSFPLTPSAS